MLNIIMAFAQLERETIAERVRDNYYHRFALGGWPGGPAPLGFDIGRITDSTGRHGAAKEHPLLWHDQGKSPLGK